jgi:hypothetical protein
MSFAFSTINLIRTPFPKFWNYMRYCTDLHDWRLTDMFSPHNLIITWNNVFTERVVWCAVFVRCDKSRSSCCSTGTRTRSYFLLYCYLYTQYNLPCNIRYTVRSYSTLNLLMKDHSRFRVFCNRFTGSSETDHAIVHKLSFLTFQNCEVQPSMYCTLSNLPEPVVNITLFSLIHHVFLIWLW